MAIKGSGVIYLQRERFEIYTTLQPVVLEFPFVADIVRDLDVVNRELFENILKVFIESNKILPCSFTIVLADNVCFIKDFALPVFPQEPTATPEQIKDLNELRSATKKEVEKQEKDFVEHVPFEMVASKKFTLQNGERVFAANQELYESIQNSFASHGLSVEAVIPGELYGNNLGALPVLTPEAANVVIQTTPTLKQYNLLIQAPQEQEQAEEKSEFDVAETQVSETPKNDHKREILLSAVFGILMIILIAVYFMSSQKPTRTQGQAAQPVSNTQAIPK